MAFSPSERRSRVTLGTVTAITLVSGLMLATPAAASATGATGTLRFDFGTATSPVADGYTGVGRATLYSPESGYGFRSNADMIDRDRGADADGMTRDFVAGATFEFVVDVDNGSYDITSFTGDLIASSKTVLTIEGTQQPRIAASSGTIAENRYSAIAVADGQLNILVGGESSRLNGLIVSPALGAPTLTAVVDLDVEPPAVELGWAAVRDAVGYRVYRASEAETPELLAQQSGTGYVDMTGVLGRSYTYTLTALGDSNVESAPSEPINVTLADPGVEAPNAPTELVASAVNRNDITIAWNAVDGASFYLVGRATNSDGPFTEVASVVGSTFTDTSVLTTRPYFYQVSAVGRGGTSAQSAVLETPAPTVLLRQAEYLDRAPVAVAHDGGVYLGWRMLGLDDDGVAFNVYRDGSLITKTPITDSTNYVDTVGTVDSRYLVTAIVDGTETTVTEEFTVWDDQSLDIGLQKPAGGVTPSGEAYGYEPNDASIGDLNGDGQYEIILKWNPTNAKDNSRSGYTGNVYLDAYELDGTQLWRIDLGRNIRAGAHYTQFQVFDYDSDGKAEVAVKTADATVDGTGVVIGDPDADFRNSGGYVLSGPEYLTVFDGETGAALDTVDYTPARGDVGSWGDTYGNRVDRFLAATAYLDGEHPSMIFSRGYYTRAVTASYDFRNGQIEQRWVFDTDEPGYSELMGQGNHNLAIADVDSDGLDEIVFGAMTIDDTGVPLYNTNLHHGDALHVGDLNPERDGLEVFGVHEDVRANGGIGASMRDAQTGEVLWTVPGTRDTGRGVAADVDPRYAGDEAWSIGGDYKYNSRIGTMKSTDGKEISTAIPAANFVTWWDGDLLREITDHDYTDPSETASGATPTVSKWNWETQSSDELLRMDGSLSVNGTKGNPTLQADLLGDWREELLVRSADGNSLQLVTTTDQTEHRIRTLMHDPVYRLGVAWQNTGYNQPPQTSFFLGDGMATPSAPSIVYTGAPVKGTLTISDSTVGQGKKVEITGTGFGTDEEIELTLLPGRIPLGVATTTRHGNGNGHATDNGQFVVKVKIPKGTPAGDYTVEAVGADSATSGSAPVTVTDKKR